MLRRELFQIEGRLCKQHPQPMDDGVGQGAEGRVGNIPASANKRESNKVVRETVISKCFFSTSLIFCSMCPTEDLFYQLEKPSVCGEGFLSITVQFFPDNSLFMLRNLWEELLSDCQEEEVFVFIWKPLQFNIGPFL